MIDAYQEVVVRDLALNSPNGLRELKAYAFAVGRKIAGDPRRKDHRTISVAKLPNFNGLSPFLKKIIGFKYERDHGDRLETVLYLPFVEKDQTVLLETIREGLEWLDAKVRLILFAAESARCHPDRPIAEVVVRLHLPTGQIVEGGFQSNECLDCVLCLARSLYNPDKRGKVHLRFMNESAPMIEGFQECTLTLAELGFKFQVSLTVSLLDESERSNSMKQGHGAESDERQKQKDQAIARRKEQMKNQASKTAFRAEVLYSFKEDRETFPARAAKKAQMEAQRLQGLRERLPSEAYEDNDEGSSMHYARVQANVRKLREQKDRDERERHYAFERAQAAEKARIEREERARREQDERARGYASGNRSYYR